MTSIRKAWRVSWRKTPDIVNIVSETTRERARRSCMLQIQDAGWKPQWIDIRAIREPKHDEWARRTRYRCVSEDFVAIDVTGILTEAFQ